MLAAAVRDYVVNFAVAAGDRTVVVTNNDDAYRTAIALKEAGLEVPVILDARATVNGIAVTSSSNTFANTVAGVTFNALKETTDPVEITVSNDTSKVK